MKRKLTKFLATILAVALATAAIAGPNGHVTLIWTYDTNLLSTNLCFLWYESTNITVPMNQWQLYTNVVGTNLSVQLDIVPGEHYFVGTASNFWGETSVFSAIAYTPPLPLPLLAVKIEKAP